MRNISLIIALFFTSLFFSCGESFFDSVVEIEIPEHEAQLAVTAHLSTIDELSMVHVTHTLGVLDSNNAQPITDATVELYENGSLLQSYSYQKLEEYTDHRGQKVVRDIYAAENVDLKPNANYELRVQQANYGNLTATQELSSLVPIISATYEKDGIVDQEGDRGDEIAIKIQDPANEQNYYLIEVTGIYEYTQSDGSIVEVKNKAYLSPADPTLEDGLAGRIILSDVTIDGKEHTLKMAAYNLVEQNGLTKIEIALHAISEDRYLYEKSLVNYNDNDGNPFAEPVVIHENVSQGNGIFTLSTVSNFMIEL